MSGADETAGISAAELRRLERKKKLLARSEKTDDQLNATLASGNVAELEAKQSETTTKQPAEGSFPENGASLTDHTNSVQETARDEADEHANLTGGPGGPGLHRDLFEEFKQDLKNQKEYETYVNMKTD